MNTLEMELFIALNGHGDHSAAVLLALDVAAKLPPVYGAAHDLLKAAEMALTFGSRLPEDVRSTLASAVAAAKEAK